MSVLLSCCSPVPGRNKFYERTTWKQFKRAQERHDVDLFVPISFQVDCCVELAFHPSPCLGGEVIIMQEVVDLSTKNIFWEYHSDLLFYISIKVLKHVPVESLGE